jgi:ABC-type multidrug transport system ATPase subunit
VRRAVAKTNGNGDAAHVGDVDDTDDDDDDDDCYDDFDAVSDDDDSDASKEENESLRNLSTDTTASSDTVISIGDGSSTDAVKLHGISNTRAQARSRTKSTLAIATSAAARLESLDCGGGGGGDQLIDLVFKDVTYSVREMKTSLFKAESTPSLSSSLNSGNGSGGGGGGGRKEKDRRPLTTQAARKMILRGASGIVRHNEVCGVIGPSGAGKTSLLSILGGKIALRGGSDAAHHGDGDGSERALQRVGAFGSVQLYGRSEARTPPRKSNRVGVTTVTASAKGSNTSLLDNDHLSPMSPGSAALSNSFAPPHASSSSSSSSSAVRERYPPTAATRRQLLGTVTQNTDFLPSLTVRETLLFAARIRYDHASAAAKAEATAKRVCNNAAKLNGGVDTTVSLSSGELTSLLYSRVDALLHTLGLRKCANTPVGHSDGGGKGEVGISGGERRRLAVGVKLIGGSAFLLLDEPLSGLDSTAATALLAALHMLAKPNAQVRAVRSPTPGNRGGHRASSAMAVAAGAGRGRGSLLTVHQPSTRMFFALDKVLILSAQGRMAFFGAPSQVLSHFESLGFRLPTAYAEEAARRREQQRVREARAAERAAVRAANGNNDDDDGDDGDGDDEDDDEDDDEEDDAVAAAVNPASYALSIVSSMSRDTRRRLNPPKNGGVSASAAAVADEISAAYGDVATEDSATPWITYRRSPHRSFCRQVLLLARRYRLHVVRQPSVMITHTVGTIVAALSMGIAFWQLNDNYTKSGALTRFGVFTFASAYFAFTALSAADVFIENRRLIKAEINAGWYSNSAYYLATSIVHVSLLRLFAPLLLAAVAYMIIGLHPLTSKFLVFVLVLTLVHLVATQLMFLISMSSRTTGQANFVAVILLLLALAFSPLMVDIADMKPGNVIRYLVQLSFLRHSVEALSINEFVGLQMVFNPDGGGNFLLDGGRYVQNFGMNVTHLWLDVAILCAFLVALLLIGLVVVNYVHTQLIDMELEGDCDSGQQRRRKEAKRKAWLARSEN